MKVIARLYTKIDSLTITLSGEDGRVLLNFLRDASIAEVLGWGQPPITELMEHLKMELANASPHLR